MFRNKICCEDWWRWSLARSQYVFNSSTSKEHLSDAELPEEIQDAIVDLLSNDKRSLLSCRLVCSRWLTRSRQWLFHDAIFAVPGSKTKESDIERSKKLVGLLQSPHSTLGPSIRKIIVIGPDSVPCTCCETIGYGSNKTYGPLSEALEASLPLLASARDIDLRQFVFSNLTLRAREQLAALSHVVSLECYGVTFPSLTAMLAPYPNLKTLGVDGVIVDEDYDESTNAEKPPVFHALTTITSFSVTIAESSFALLLSSPKYFLPQCIVSLSFATVCNPSYESIMARFITMTGVNLEHLTLDLQHYDYEDGMFFHVRGLKKDWTFILVIRTHNTCPK